MTGPMPRGHWMSDVKPESWGMLHPGAQYRVTLAFRDFDHFEHVVGESWTYLGSAFLPYDDGLSLYVSLDGVQEWHIRMQLRPEEQGPIVDQLKDYLAQVRHAPPPPAPTRSLKAPLILFGASCCAVVLAFLLLHQGDRSPSFVAAGTASLAYGLGGVVIGALGLLGGLTAMIWIGIRGGRSHA